MSKVAIALSHGHTAKWLQLVINSLKQTKNEVEADIYVACTWPDHPSIRAITANDLGDNVTLINCQRRLHSHATGLDEILEHIEDKGYDYMFTTETDCRVCKDGWLDWFLSHMKDAPQVGMAGFFWHEGKNHYNINASGTLYRTDMLLKYNKEVRENNEGIFYHPKGNKMDTENGMDSSIKDVVGVFSETRGIKDPNDLQKTQILEGIPHPAWFEPGSWVYYRSLGEYESVRVHVDHIYQKWAGGTAPEGTYYGGKADPWLIHYWGGTRCYDFLKHRVDCNFVKGCAPEWIKREDRLWKEFVPGQYHNDVHCLMNDIQMREKMQENLGFVVDEAF